MPFFDLNSLFAYNKEWAKPGPYVTKLSDKEESQYRSWLDELNAKVRPNNPLNPDDPGYDMRGYFKSLKAGNVKAPTTSAGHFPDTFKTPYHPTFSRESMYAKENAPYWKDDILYEPSGAITYGYLMVEGR